MEFFARVQNSWALRKYRNISIYFLKTWEILHKGRLIEKVSVTLILTHAAVIVGEHYFGSK